MIRHTLPTLGMGTAGLGNLYRAVAPEVAFSTIEAALAAGIRYFDTAPHYGFGLAETRIGDALKELDPKQAVLLSTKVGRLLEPTDERGERHDFVDAAPFRPVFDYSHDAVLRSHDESLRRLRRDHVDILLAHDLGRMTHGDRADVFMRQFLDSGYSALEHLRATGAVSAIGVGVNEVEVCEYLLARVDLDVILLAGRFTMLDQSAAKNLLELCISKNVAVIIGGPYNSGILATRPNAWTGEPPKFDYAAAPTMIVERVAAMAEITARHGVDLPTAALQFPLLHRAVTTVIPGLVGREEVAASVKRISAAIPPALWSELADNDLLSLPIFEPNFRSDSE